MTSRLPINLEDLLRQRTVEGERIEYKAGWNPDAVVRTICAFANHFHNLGGGYIIVGVAGEQRRHAEGELEPGPQRHAPAVPAAT